MVRSTSTPAKSREGSDGLVVRPKTFRLLGQKRDMDLTDLHQEIFKELEAAGGALPFRRFMELALYHPEHGYYASGRAQIGKEGDFFTSVSMGRIYGRLLACVCREVWERLDKPTEFSIVEQGANDGNMAADLLDALREEDDAFTHAACYLIVEPFAINRQRQQERLRELPEVRWIDSIDDLPEFTGIHLSNELLDAFPVDSLRWNGSVWEEECLECVENNAGTFAWCARPITDPSLLEAAKFLPIDLPEGFRLEVNPGMKPWLETLHRKLQRGLILAVDYGQSGDDRYAPHRSDGTLLAFQNHERFNDPLSKPGHRDITAQVDFTTLGRMAKEVGFEILGYSDQHHFLVGAAEPWLLSLGDFTEKSDAAKDDLRSLQALLNPGSMGMQFKSIALGKKFPSTPPLGCFRHQRPGVAAL